MDCLQTVSELYMYSSSVSLPVNDPYQTLVSLRQSILCGYDSVTFFLFGGGGRECLICLIVLVVKQLTGFAAFGPPVKDFALGVSVVILDGASVLQILKDVVSSIPTMFLKRYVISTFCAVDRVYLVCGTC